MSFIDTETKFIEHCVHSKKKQNLKQIVKRKVVKIFELQKHENGATAMLLYIRNYRSFIEE